MHHLHSHISSTEDIYVNKVNDPQSIDQGITTNRLIIPCLCYSNEQTLSLYKFALSYNCCLLFLKNSYNKDERNNQLAVMPWIYEF